MATINGIERVPTANEILEAVLIVQSSVGNVGRVYLDYKADKQRVNRALLSVKMQLKELDELVQAMP